jgi:FKBP-type peptidyl-prolyl cis-trans isomerase 2
MQIPLIFRVVIRYGYLFLITAMILSCNAHTRQTLPPSSDNDTQIAEQVVNQPAEHSDHIQSGDFVTVNYSLRLKSGELVVTNIKELAEDPAESKVEWFVPMQSYEPEQLIAGKEQQSKHLADAVVGMSLGEKKVLDLSSEQVYGNRDETLVKTFGTQKKIPATLTMGATDFVAQFGAFPVINDEVSLTPYYNSKVINIGKDSVTLQAQAEEGAVTEAGFGQTRISMEGDMVVTTLTPRLNAPFELKGVQGTIVNVAADHFDVDFNHPGAGRPMLLEVEVVSLVRASDFRDKQPQWIEDHDKGYEYAAKDGKPMVLVLYAGWCQWSKRLLTETIPDPRIEAYWNDYIWVKVDSDKEKSYHDYYGQNGFPMVVLVSPEGQIVKKLDGFQNARSLRRELAAYLSAMGKG